MATHHFIGFSSDTFTGSGSQPVLSTHILPIVFCNLCDGQNRLAGPAALLVTPASPPEVVAFSEPKNGFGIAHHD